jgi:hypothetical protein
LPTHPPDMISMSREAVLQLLLREAQEGVRGRCSRGAAAEAASSPGSRSLGSFRPLRPVGTVCHGSSGSLFTAQRFLSSARS